MFGLSVYWLYKSEINYKVDFSKFCNLIIDQVERPKTMATTDATEEAMSSLGELDAMDAVTYCKLISRRGQDPYFQQENHEFNDGIMAFRSDLLKFKVVWYNDWKKDWICWQRNNHALYSIFKCPKYHEYSSRERAVTFVCASVIFSIAAMIAVITEDSMIRAGDSSLSIFFVVNIINLAGGITAGLVEGILKECATCACAQGVENETITKRMERLGHIFIGLYAFTSIGACIAGAITAQSYGLLGKYFLGWWTGILAFLVVPTILLTIVFHILWKKQSSQDKMGDNSNFMVDATEYVAFINGEECPRKQFPNINDRKTRVMKVVKAGAKDNNKNKDVVKSDDEEEN